MTHEAEAWVLWASGQWWWTLGLVLVFVALGFMLDAVWGES